MITKLVCCLTCIPTIVTKIITNGPTQKMDIFQPPEHETEESYNERSTTGRYDLPIGFRGYS